MAKNEIKFEEALKDLEQTVRDMERGDLGLDELLADFEKGIGLLRVCEKKLAEAEGKIAVLTKAEIAAAEEDEAAVFADEDDFDEPQIPEDELPF